MRWYEATVYEAVQTGTDATRNPTYELVGTDRVLLVRNAPRSYARDSTEGNAHDYEERTFVTKADPALVEGAAAIEVGGALYDVVGVSSRESPIALRVRRCKASGLPDC